ncbi:hypothetical protein F443_17894 [Phytophthora nicotianae P1569]|uniref:Uncharacterized protein n=1 Tax=Phytophthora nicotianae P1569 TaxID=1317065 RepID=V9EA30_PHYNI|nr:hypothetical protein F443_17894 [Phytophthora nicotianae P1569]
MVAVARDCNSLLHNSNTTSAATTIVLAIGKEVTVTTGLAGIPQETFAALWANHGNSTLKDISAIRERREALPVASKFAENRPSLHSWTEPQTASVGFCRSMCDLLVDARLVKMFFYNFVRGMDSYENKDGLASGFGALARRFDWSGIGSEILESLGDTVDPMSMDMGMHM